MAYLGMLIHHMHPKCCFVCQPTDMAGICLSCKAEVFRLRDRSPFLRLKRSCQVVYWVWLRRSQMKCVSPFRFNLHHLRQHQLGARTGFNYEENVFLLLLLVVCKYQTSKYSINREEIKRLQI